MLQSWSNQDEVNHPSVASAEAWAPQAKASSFQLDPTLLAQFGRFHQPAAEAAPAPLATRFETAREESHLATRLEIPHMNDVKELSTAAKDQREATPLSRIYDILDVHSDSSRWLEKNGYLESFKSPDCTLDLTFGTDPKGSKIGAVMTAPDGTKRTVVSCEGGVTFQRLTAADGRELVKFLSSGQIVELNPKRNTYT